MVESSHLLLHPCHEMEETGGFLGHMDHRDAGLSGTHDIAPLLASVSILSIADLGEQQTVT